MAAFTLQRYRQAVKELKQLEEIKQEFQQKIHDELAHKQLPCPACQGDSKRKSFHKLMNLDASLWNYHGEDGYGDQTITLVSMSVVCPKTAKRVWIKFNSRSLLAEFARRNYIWKYFRHTIQRKTSDISYSAGTVSEKFEIEFPTKRFLLDEPV